MSSKSLLPKVRSDFGSSEYWEKFFRKREDTFEWYGTFLELCGILAKYIKKTDLILHLGCGNSALSADMYDFGYTSIINVDYSQTVINQMSMRYADRPLMKWEVEDVTKLSYEDDKYNVIVDKGTLDAIFNDTDEATVAKVETMFSEVTRVLKKGGRFILVTLAQDFILNKVMQYFSKDWLVRIHKIEFDAMQIDAGMAGGRTPKYSPYAFILTKFPNLPQPVIEICYGDNAKPTRMKNIEEAIEVIHSHQQYRLIQYKIVNEEVKEPPPIDMFSDSGEVESPRYRLYIVNSRDFDPTRQFGVFIVPHGREEEYMFASSKGRVEQLAASARFKRLIIVALNRNHNYEGGMQQIQDELSEKVMDFAPKGLPQHYKAPFLTCGGGDLGERNLRQKLTIQGISYVIEDYVIDDVTRCRRLAIDTFPDVANVLAAVRLKKDRKKKKVSFVPNYTVNVNMERLTEEDSTSAVLLGTNLTLGTPEDFKVLVLGLAENLQIITYLLMVYPKARLVVYDENEEVLKLLKTWFYGLFHNYQDRFSIVHQKYETTKEGDELYDVIIHDIGSSMTSLDASCTGRVKDELRNTWKALKEKGVMFIKAYNNSNEKDNKNYSFLSEMFSSVHTIKCERSGCLVLQCNHSNDDVMETIGNNVISAEVMAAKNNAKIHAALSKELNIESMLTNWKRLSLKSS